MKRGFFFTLTVISLFSLLFLLSANKMLSTAQGDELSEISRLRKVAYTWDDVNEDLESVINLSITHSENNLTFSDSLPAARDLTTSFVAYGLFVENHYKTPEINVSFLSNSGSEIPISSLRPPVQVQPYGINYSYPDNGKNELFIDAPAGNFAAIRQLHLNISLPNHWYNEVLSDIANNPCNFWSPLKKCTGGTNHCIDLTIRIVDINGTTYKNTGCSQFDADKNSNLQLNLNYPGGNNAWIKLLVGQLPDLLDVQFQNTNLTANTTMVLNSTDFNAGIAKSLRVLEPSTNASKTDSITN